MTFMSMRCHTPPITMFLQCLSSKLSSAAVSSGIICGGGGGRGSISESLSYLKSAAADSIKSWGFDLLEADILRPTLNEHSLYFYLLLSFLSESERPAALKPKVSVLFLFIIVNKHTRRSLGDIGFSFLILQFTVINHSSNNYAGFLRHHFSPNTAMSLKLSSANESLNLFSIRSINGSQVHLAAEAFVSHKCIFMGVWEFGVRKLADSTSSVSRKHTPAPRLLPPFSARGLVGNSTETCTDYHTTVLPDTPHKANSGVTRPEQEAGLEGGADGGGDSGVRSKSVVGRDTCEDEGGREDAADE
ncbi:hypothetical protein E2C01_006574 [Portunus trituberculatus]|uniref:Uncharacterized protein n=1 Tax=Portunus trituberculatus TaxID=210409 RepID=A0A5B7CZX0_PORTR|nr:hypothetical protein [Portunus trituberculatus]